MKKLILVVLIIVSALFWLKALHPGVVVSFIPKHLHNDSMHAMHANMIVLEVLNDGYFSQLDPILADEVELTLATGDCCGMVSKSEVKEKLASVVTTDPWLVETDANNSLVAKSGNITTNFTINRGLITKIVVTNN